MPYLDVKGATSLRGTRYLGVEVENRTIWIRERAFLDKKHVLKVLARHDVVLMEKKPMDSFFQRASSVKAFPERKIAEKFGWNGDAYVFRDGSVAAAGAEYEGVDAELQLTPGLVAGSLDDYHENVIRPLKSNPLGLFALAVPLAAPLLKFIVPGFNPAFELVGPTGIGKTTLQKVAVSVSGPWMTDSGPRIWSDHLGGKDDAAKLTALFRDGALILDSRDPSRLGTSAAQKHAAYRSNAVRLTDSSVGRLVVLSSSNETLAHWLGKEEALAASRPHTFVIPVDGRQFGVFDHVPDDFHSAGDLADHVAHSCSQLHGVMFDHFVRKLVHDLEARPGHLEKSIRSRMARFREATGIEPNDGASRRRADAFGVVYAAAWLAGKWNVLPAKIPVKRYRPAVMTAYRLNLGSFTSAADVETTLLEAAQTKAVRCGPNAVGTSLVSAPYIIRSGSESAEFWITQDGMRELFGNWEQLRCVPAIAALFGRGKDGLLIKKKQLGGVKLGRRYTYELPAGWDSGSPLFEE